MIIRKLKLKNYRKFASKEIRFATGLTVVLGPNEAGKSTVAEAILDALFADPASKSRQLQQRISSWAGENQAVLNLEFEHGKYMYVLEKDFGRHEARISLQDGSKSAEGSDAVRKTLTKLLSLPGQAVYESTAFIRHRDMAQIETGKDFTAALQNAVSTTNDGGAVTVIATLEDKLKELRKGRDRLAKNPGDIKEAEDLVNELQMQLQDKTAQWEKLKAAKEQGKESGSKLEEIEQKLADLQKLLENHKKREEAETKLAGLQTRLEEIQNLLSQSSELGAKRDVLERQLGQYKLFATEQVEEAARRITAYTEQRKSLESELRQLPPVPVVPQEEEPGLLARYQHYLAAAGSLLAGLLLALMAQSAAFAGLGVVLAVISFFAFKKQLVSNNTQRQAAQELAMRYQQKQAQLQEVSKLLEQQLHAFQVNSEQDFYTRKADYLALREQLTEITAGLKGMLSGKSLEELRKEQVGLLTQKKEIEVNVLDETVKNSRLSPQDYLRKRREVDMLLLEKKRAEDSSTASRVRQEDASVDRDTIVSLEERLEAAKTRLSYHKKQEQVISLALETIKQSLQQTAQSAQGAVSQLIERYLPQLTGKRYSQARLRDDLTVEVFSPEKNDWVVPTEVLSTGTVDQIYFLARLAFIKTISGGEQLPVILDDPFVTFDAARREQVKKILQEFAQDYQVIFLTHYPEYEDWGDAVVRI